MGPVQWEFLVRMYTLTGGGLIAAVLLASTPAMAQRNPFVPPAGGGMSKAQMQALVKAEVARQAAAAQGGTAAGGGIAAQMKGAKPGLPGAGAAAAVGALPSQTGGAPTGVSTASGKNAPAGALAGGVNDDPVSKLLEGGGQFVGCVSSTPVFKDKDGRRAYFTSKELKASDEAKRIARCG